MSPFALLLIASTMAAGSTSVPMVDPPLICDTWFGLACYKKRTKLSTLSHRAPTGLCSSTLIFHRRARRLGISRARPPWFTPGAEVGTLSLGVEVQDDVW